MLHSAVAKVQNYFVIQLGISQFIFSGREKSYCSNTTTLHSAVVSGYLYMLQTLILANLAVEDIGQNIPEKLLAFLHRKGRNTLVLFYIPMHTEEYF